MLAETTVLHLLGLGFYISSFDVMVLLIGVYFADQEYIGYRIGFYEGLSHRREALGGGEPFASGSAVTVYYNPRRPEQSTLDTAIPRWDSSIPSTGKRLMAIGAVIFVFGLIMQWVLSARSV
jgi:hypothetical protein